MHQRCQKKRAEKNNRGKQMKISVITVGKIKEKYLRDAIAEYSKRLSRYCKLEIIEVAEAEVNLRTTTQEGGQR